MLVMTEPFLSQHKRKGSCPSLWLACPDPEIFQGAGTPKAMIRRPLEPTGSKGNVTRHLAGDIETIRR